MVKRCDRNYATHQYCCGRCHEPPGRLRFYIRCGECKHIYRTRWHLLLAYWREHVRHWWQDWRHGTPLPPLPSFLGDGGDDLVWEPTRWWHVLSCWWRPGQIPFCQCCIHDF